MDDLTRIWEDLVGRLHGPMTFRLLLQPTMALIFAVRDGMKDARLGHPAYFWALFTQKEYRREMLRDGWKSIARVFILGIVMDIIYQLIVFRWVYPFEVLIVAVTLAILPYLFLRGPVNRIARRLRHEEAQPNHETNKA